MISTAQNGVVQYKGCSFRQQCGILQRVESISSSNVGPLRTSGCVMFQLKEHPEYLGKAVSTSRIQKATSLELSDEACGNHTSNGH